ncbi:hypothetical protein [Spirosoma gilvum]
MSTDRFSDIIRRKLESIRPEFTEKDWTRMQATLQQAGPPQADPTATGKPFSGGVWTGHPWLLAAASVSTALLIAYSVWQHNEINHLQETIGQLKKQPATNQTAPKSVETDRPMVSQTEGAHQPAQRHESLTTSTPKEELATRHDTVYITRYITIPSQPRLEPMRDRLKQPTETPPEQRYATASREPAVGSPSRQERNLNKNLKTNPYGVSSTPLTNDITSTTRNQTVAGNEPSALTGLNQPEERLVNSRGRDNKSGDNSLRNAPSETKGNYPRTRDNGSVNVPTNQGNSVVDNQGTVAIDQSQSTATESAQSAPAGNFDLLASRPLSTESANWNVLLTQRARRMRPARTTVVMGQPQAPESQRIEPAIAKFRAGVGGEVSAHLWSTGIFAEIPIAKHVMVGVGLSRAVYLGGTFLTADDFDIRTRRNFKQEFGRQLPPTVNFDSDILDIDTRVIRVQVPITLGFRVPLSRSLTFQPTMGTFMNLSSKEKLTYYYRVPQRGFNQIDFSTDCGTELFSGFTFSTGLEWQRNRWVVQGIPTLTLPTSVSTLPGPGWENNTTVGLRARLMYQF